MIQHKIELHDLHAHLFKVTLTIPEPTPNQAFSMAVWIPGSYLVREFSKQVQELNAKQGGKKLPFTQLTKNKWSLANTSTKPITVTYLVYAFDASVRTAYLDAARGFFNGTSLFMRVAGQEHNPQQVVIESSARPELVEGWRVATSLPALKTNKAGWGIYQAEHYDELADSPFELGDFWEGAFTARGIKHRFVVSGAAATFDGKRLLADTQKIVAAELEFWHGSAGKPPQALLDKGYVFMLRAMDNGYGGLEHMNSTALIAKRSDLPRVGDSSATTEGVSQISEGYVTLLGLISHEYFHTWNVKRLRPAGLVPYDYDRENYTELLWFFEGFTSYYDDLLLRRAGLINDEQYLGLVAKTINQVQQTPGRLVHSLASSSFEAWTKYYRMDENSVNSTVSYYSKGSLVALCLDLMLHERGSNLDQVMQSLWQKHCLPHKPNVAGITEAHILEAIPDKACRQALLQWVHTTIDMPLTKLLASAGIDTVAVKANLAQQLGLRAGTDGGIKIKQVLTDTLAHKAGFSAGDEWVAIEVKDQTWRITTLEDVLLYAPSGKPITAWVARDKQMLKLTLTLPKNQMLNADVKLKITDAKKLTNWLS
jgi:predicted metalloprotease with PDZ domain